MRIAIVGSGAASVGVLRALSRLKLKAEITLFDIGKTIEKPRLEYPSIEEIRAFHNLNYSGLKKQLGFRFPPLKTVFSESLSQYKVAGRSCFFRSEHLGGLTNFWGGTMLPFDGEDFADWPINAHDMHPYYHDIADMIGISGRQDGLSRCFSSEYINRPAVRILKGMQALSAGVNARQAKGAYDVFSGVNRVALETRDGHDNACVYCGECMAGCVMDSVYNARTSVEQFIEEMDIKYVRGKVLRLSTESSAVMVEADAGGRTSKLFDKVFLCAGCVATTEIVMRSLGLKSGPVLTDNTIFQFPILNYGLGQSDADRQRYFSLSSLIFACQPRSAEKYASQVQLYPNFDYLWRNCMPESMWPAAKPLVSLFRDRLIWGRMYLHGKLSDRYLLALNETGELTFQRVQKADADAAKGILESIKSVVNHDGFHVLPVKLIQSMSSSHLAGTLPYGGGIVPLATSGEVMPNTFICDSACFPSSPAGSPTFTIMANASRTTTEALF